MQTVSAFQVSFNVQNLYPQHIGSKTVALTPINLNPYSPGHHELRLVRFQAFKMMQHKAMLGQNKLNDVKEESGLKSEEIREKIESDIKTETKQEQTTQLSSLESFTVKPESSKEDLKGEIKKLLRFLLSNMGQENETLLDDARNYYLQNPALLQVYDKLRMRYYSAKKCKEDIIRYILRKAFRSIRTSIMKEQQVSSKKASLLLCKRHFYHRAEQMEKFEDEDQLLESLMPFNKNSKNKTMNLSFVLEIFTSQSFCEEYQRFLPEFNRIVVEEHRNKEEKLVNMLVNCVEKNSFCELKNIARLPWTDVWIEDAKNVAIGIMPNKRLVYNYKKPKI